MYQVTALYEDAEIGYGEGDSYLYALNECNESVPQMYHELPAGEVTYSVARS
jgi:hypothetical protein